MCLCSSSVVNSYQAGLRFQTPSFVAESCAALGFGPARNAIAHTAQVIYNSWLSSHRTKTHAQACKSAHMNCCGTSKPRKSGGHPGSRAYHEEPEPVEPPNSPTWKLPPFPAPALPPLTRQNKVIITCSQFMEEPEEAAKLKRQILNGSGEALSVVFGELHATSTI